MSKTAREVMTPGDGWPTNEFANDDAARVVGSGRRTHAGGLDDTHAIGADDRVDRALATMTELMVRRLPVVDRGHLVGTVSQGDLARSIDRPETWSWLCS